MHHDHAEPATAAPRRRRRRSPLRWLVVLAVLAAFALGLHEISKLRCFALLGPLVCKVETVRPEVALTFDDGPTALGVDAVLPVLREHGARATFFLVGRELEARPELARRIVAAGHEVANHAYSHQRMLLRSQAFYDRELKQTENLLDQVRQEDEPGLLFRPPYGKKLPGVALSMREQGLIMVTWSVEEPKTDDPAAYAREIVEKAKPGDIILMHPMYAANATARAALPQVLEGLQAKGLRVITVTEMMDGARADAEAKARAKDRR
ncbi:polysaccharide deacetylase family protein [Phenylobacterium sp.]|uniref:polysaccharide deacetylase family protein n=1 Tax=Phenylobacterium sp. TaxID=1871053 RepID=UPI0035B33A16